MDTLKIIELYTKNKYTLKKIAQILQTKPHLIKRILIQNGVKITNKNRYREPFTQEHKKKISESRKKLKLKGWKPYNLGLKTINRKNGKELLLRNMIGHLKYDINLSFLSKFEDIDRLKELNHLLSKQRVSKHFDTEKYKNFIIKFYNDKNFIKQYNKYLKTKNKWDRPSLDHIIPISLGGSWNLENLQVLSWFENRAKCNMTEEEYKRLVKEYYQGGNNVQI